jgi:hypothetical protein
MFATDKGRFTARKFIGMVSSAAIAWLHAMTAAAAKQTIRNIRVILILLETEDISDHVIRLSLREDEVGHIPMG